MPGTAGRRSGRCWPNRTSARCQRFRLAAGRGRSYLALWTLQSPDAFKTSEYTSDWGFFEWGPHITDWSRDLFDGGASPEAGFAVPPHGALHVVSFDGMTVDAATAARDIVAHSQPGVLWLPVIGLDRHTALIGLKPIPDAETARVAGSDDAPGHQEAIYRPISAFCTAE